MKVASLGVILITLYYTSTNAGYIMTRRVSYKKLWHMLIDRDMKKTDLKKMAKISPATLANMAADRHVSMEILERICSALDCDFSDIIEAVPDEKEGF